MRLAHTESELALWGDDEEDSALVAALPADVAAGFVTCEHDFWSCALSLPPSYSCLVCILPDDDAMQAQAQHTRASSVAEHDTGVFFSTPSLKRHLCLFDI